MKTLQDIKTTDFEKQGGPSTHLNISLCMHIKLRLLVQSLKDLFKQG
jgi:hypothetical protein